MWETNFNILYDTRGPVYGGFFLIGTLEGALLNTKCRPDGFCYYIWSKQTSLGGDLFLGGQF